VQRGILLVAAALCGCKSPGTITLDFDLDGSTCAAFGSPYWTTGAGSAARCDDMSIAIDHYVLYAEPDGSCSVCACGGCPGSPNSVTACPDALGNACTSVDDLELDLPPGSWAVVLEAYAKGNPTRPSCLVASQCIQVTVDADGTRSGTDELAEGGCAVCAM
jgi:hypothetical protein